MLTTTTVSPRLHRLALARIIRTQIEDMECDPEQDQLSFRLRRCLDALELAGDATTRGSLDLANVRLEKAKALFAEAMELTLREVG